jgi:hypothetical protein
MGVRHSRGELQTYRVSEANNNAVKERNQMLVCLCTIAFDHHDMLVVQALIRSPF